MHLKTMTITGFKSFADRSKLDFEPGLTAIVGPNGCGKSNVMDAFRWCMGEMSAKSLRSNLMLDVVFNGSGSRPPQNMAEVTLTFDNTDKRLPIDFSDVSITRRLFRSGESEYFINKAQCRLRDLRELFLDTGMGEDGYWSMEQGKVEWVLSAKPEQRRELFEEAAGVSKYRARREEAIRKLDRVEIDLSRLNDILSVTRDQIRKLENAVNRAKTYERIRAELKVMEIQDWLAQLDNIGMEKSAIQTDLEETGKKAEEINTLTHQIDADLAELRRQMTQQEEELLEANSRLAAIEADIKIGEEREANSDVRKQELEERIVQVSDSIEKEKIRIAELDDQFQKQTDGLNQFQDASREIQTGYQAAKEAVEKALADLEDKRNAIKTERDTVLQRAHERAQTQHRIAQLSSDSSRHQSNCENIEKEIGRISLEKEKAAAAVQEKESQKTEWEQQLGKKSNALSALNVRIEQLKEQEKSLRQTLLENSESIAKLKGQIHSLEEREKQDPYLSGTKSVLEAQLTGISGPIGQLFHGDERDRDLIQAVLGENLGDLVADTLDDAQRAVDFLAQSGGGRCRLWVLDRIPSEPALAQTGAWWSRIQTEDKFKPLVSYLCSDLWVQNGSIYGHAIVNGGVDPSHWKTVTPLQLSELQEALAAKEKERADVKTQLDETIRQLTQSAAERDAALKENEEIRIRLEVIGEDLEKQSQRLALHDDEMAAVQKEWEETRRLQIEAETAVREAQKNFDELHKKEKEDHERLDVMQQELTELQRFHSDTNADFSIKQEQYNGYQEKLQWHQSVLDHTTRDRENRRNNRSANEQSLGQIQSEIEASLNAKKEARELIQQSLEKRKGAAHECERIQEARTRLAEEIQSKDADLHQKRDELSLVQEKIQENRLRAGEINNKQANLSQKLWEQYELSLDDAKKEFQSQAADPEALEKLKKRVANIGPINLAAPQEHAELSEKNEFLSKQHDDLVQAKEDLKQVISKINSTTRDHFRDTFQKVRENFRQIYSKLFSGGEADLRLTDESDMLSAGIDIFCQPPGKKLLHISLLSGGEKALTACALLFAFFQVRPSPVALLDEVDAPLDEANVLRFVEFLKEFSEKTQFILISHNKRTMEVANTLYGVTMEEFGVSKVISARISKDGPVKEHEPEPQTVQS